MSKRPDRNEVSNALKGILGDSLTYSIRAFVISRPGLFFRILPFIQKNTSLGVSKDTKAVITGIWGCANTFATWTFIHRQPDLPISHHMHVPAQVIQAARMNIPCLVLIRNPVDATVSVVGRAHFDFTTESLRWALKDYAHFYESIEQYNDQFVLSDFQEVISNYPAAIQRLNEKFGTNFTVPENDSDEAKEIVATHKVEKTRHLHPHEDIKAALLAPEFESYRLHAEEVYKRMCKAHNVPVHMGKQANEPA
jgi:hypothetical protein